MHSHPHPPAAHKLPYARPLTIPEVNEEDDGGGGCALPVVSETTGRSSSRWSSSRLCELEKLLSVESDTSRTSDSVGAPPPQPADATAEPCFVMHTPFCDDPKQELGLSPVPSCDHRPSGSSVSGKGASSAARAVWPPAALMLPPLQRTLLPHSERASPVVGSPGGGCGLERSMTCFPAQQALDMASVMEAAAHCAKLHLSSSSVEMASRCLPSVTLTTPAGPAPKGLGQMAYSRMGSCPGPVPYAFASVVRCGDSTAM